MSKSTIENFLLDFLEIEQEAFKEIDSQKFNKESFEPPWYKITKQLYPPFSYFGGKRDAADEVWRRFGADVPNYIEPFSGALAVLLARPITDLNKLRKSYREVANDTNSLLLNFWRTVKQENIENLIDLLDFPAHETELLSRKEAMLDRSLGLREKLLERVDFYDPTLAAYWLYVTRQWIGAGAEKRGAVNFEKVVEGSEPGYLGENLAEHLHYLSLRTRHVRFYTMDWDRVLHSHTQVTKYKCTGIFLDPPYINTEQYYGENYEHTLAKLNLSKEDFEVYAQGVKNIADQAREWAIENGENSKLKIAYCGYEDQHDNKFPKGWKKYPWKEARGRRNQRKGGQTKILVDTIWFSKYCL